MKLSDHFTNLLRSSLNKTWFWAEFQEIRLKVFIRKVFRFKEPFTAEIRICLICFNSHFFTLRYFVEHETHSKGIFLFYSSKYFNIQIVKQIIKFSLNRFPEKVFRFFIDFEKWVEQCISQSKVLWKKNHLCFALRFFKRPLY